MISLHLLGKKGLKCLENLNPIFFPSIGEVVIGKDTLIENDYSKEILALAIKHNLKVFSRNEKHETPGVNLIVAIGWRWLIHSGKNIVVFHDSLLPKYRGFNPLVTALIHGDKEIGATVLKASKEYDRGDILHQKKINITYPIKIDEAIERISLIYSELLNKFLSDYLDGALKPMTQNEAFATYSLWRDEHDYEIDWDLPASSIKRFIDAVGYPYNGAKTKINGRSVRILEAKVEKDINIANRTAGKVVFRDGLSYIIVCGKGLLRVNEFYDSKGNNVTFKNAFRLRFGK